MSSEVLLDAGHMFVGVDVSKPMLGEREMWKNLKIYGRKILNYWRMENLKIETKIFSKFNRFQIFFFDSVFQFFDYENIFFMLKPIYPVFRNRSSRRRPRSRRLCSSGHGTRNAVPTRKLRWSYQVNSGKIRKKKFF